MFGKLKTLRAERERRWRLPVPEACILSLDMASTAIIIIIVGCMSPSERAESFLIDSDSTSSQNRLALEFTWQTHSLDWTKLHVRKIVCIRVKDWNHRSRSYMRELSSRVNRVSLEEVKRESSHFSLFFCMSPDCWSYDLTPSLTQNTATRCGGLCAFWERRSRNEAKNALPLSCEIVSLVSRCCLESVLSCYRISPYRLAAARCAQSGKADI